MRQQESEKGYWDQYVYWYESWLNHSPYQQLVWQRLSPLLAGKKSFLDIGAGTGVFALAAAETVPKVCCVEIAGEMRRRIRDKAVQQGKSIFCIAKDWEQVVPEQLGYYDVVLAAHSFYQMKDIAAAFRKMLAVTGKELMIVTNANHLPGTYHKLRQQLISSGVVCTQPKVTPRYEEVVTYLTALGARPAIEIVEYNGGHYYNSLDEAVTHVLLRLGLNGSVRHIVGKVIEEHLTVADYKLHLPEPAKMAVLVWRKE